jgi:uncharacterized caspase-like protein
MDPYTTGEQSEMKTPTSLLIFIVILLFLALPAFARPRAFAGQISVCSVEGKRRLYDAFQESKQTNTSKAYDLAKKYLACPVNSGETQNTDTLKKWIASYEQSIQAATPTGGCSRENKTAWYNEFRDGANTNQMLAQELARAYLVCPVVEGEEEIRASLEKFLLGQDKATRAAKLYELLFIKPDYVAAFAFGKKILDDEPENLAVMMQLAQVGILDLGTHKNEPFYGEGLRYAEKAIHLIESGKTPDEWAPFNGKSDALGWLNYMIANYLAKNSPALSIPYLIRVLSYETSLKTTPHPYYQMAAAYEQGPQTQQTKEYREKYEGKASTPEGLAAMTSLNRIEDRIIDARAHAAALTSSNPAFQPFDADNMSRLKIYYKARHNGSEAGLEDLIKGFTPQRSDLTRSSLAGVSSVDSLKETSGGHYYALVIGNTRYPEYGPDLPMAEHDARAVADVLKQSYGFSVTLLLNAKRNQILDQLNELRSELQPNDSLLVYYAGHGWRDRATEATYWLPVDAQKTSNSNFISANDITSNVKALKSRHVLVISDSCYSGTLVRSSEPLINLPKERADLIAKLQSGKSRNLMASGGNEPVLDGGGGNHSVFAKALLIGLEQQGRDPFTAAELFQEFVLERVAGAAPQTPEYGVIYSSGHESGDFIFIRKKAN